jgi:hypothetical protein
MARGTSTRRSESDAEHLTARLLDHLAAAAILRDELARHGA